MIVAREKPFLEILSLLEGVNRVLVVGCGQCTALCQSGGRKEVEHLVSLLQAAGEERGVPYRLSSALVARQCDPRYLDSLDRLLDEAEACLSLGCGIGVQFLAERYPDKRVVPGLDTVFGGGVTAPGVWEERCVLCGECILGQTAGICPLTRCAKKLLNGPCGGAVNGRCEVASETECAWEKIYQRLWSWGRQEALEEIIPPKDWSRSESGGPRRLAKKGA